MFVLFFSFATCNRILGVDFGSQYLKFGFADLLTSEYLIEDYNQKYGIPTAFAIKTPNHSDAPLTNETLDGISIKYGKSAIRYLHKHPHHGSEYVLNSVTRDDPEFRTSTVVNQSTLLTLFFGQVLTQLDKKLTGMVLTFPSFFTPLMKQTVINGLKYFETPIKAVTDDIQALSVLYADSYLDRYMSKMRKVLFVDVGFSYAKTYVVNFTFNGQFTLSTLMASSWSENCGGHAFAKALSRSARLPIHSAEKMLKDVEDDLEFAKAELNELKRIINETVEAGGLVDEVQIIGGASRYKYIYDTVTDAVKYAYNLPPPVKKPTKKSNNSTVSTNSTNSTETVNQTSNNEKTAEKVETSEAENLASSGIFTNDQNETSTLNQSVPKVLTEFDPSTAIALGTLHYILMTENRSMFNPTYMIRKPVASYYVRCGKITDKYCQRNSMCKQPVFYNLNGCPDDIIEVLIDKRHTPTGTPEVISRSQMTNISNIVFNESEKGRRGMVKLRLPDPFVEGIAWCNSTEECYSISFKDVSIDRYDLVKQYELFEAITTKLASDADRNKYIDNIKSLIDKLDKRINPSGNTESTLKIPDTIKEKFENFKKQLQNNEFSKLSLEKVREIRDDVKSLCLTLGMKSND